MLLHVPPDILPPLGMASPPSPILTLPHPYLTISTDYHAYAPTLLSNVVNLSSLHSHYVWLPPQCLIICPIDHPYAHEHIVFCFSALYHCYASALPPHLLQSLPCLYSHTALSCSQIPIITFTQ
ncbi:hypothetical protein O181_056597 [Austropuccinia psidii MF-1]|uniref:Uncharacterized protein n=1 Tax=Austropuccinia psidii MF-1 TaxID=1389203 RepID=A0A9Q3HUL4_9BASI|nr:hypothetical protein [Austropuccinia psidii MF-1]